MKNSDNRKWNAVRTGIPMVFMLFVLLLKVSYAQSPITFSVTVKKPNCYGEKGKVIFNDISGGVAPYRYAARLIDAQGADCEFNDQCNPTTGGFCVNGHCINTSLWIQASSTNSVKVKAGQIEAIVIDDSGTITIDTVTMTQPPKLVLTTTLTDAMCSGDDGEIKVKITGGKAPYLLTVISVNNLCDQGTTLTAFVDACGNFHPLQCINGMWAWQPFNLPLPCNPNLPLDIFARAGTYELDIADANGCTFKDTVVISEPPKLVLTTTLTDAVCHGGNGVIDMDIEGGIEPYVVTVSSPLSCSTNANCSYLTGTGPCGDYSVGICKNSNCVLLFSDLCNGSGYKVSSPAGTFVIDIADANGCTLKDTVIITEPPKLILVSTTKNPMCHGEAGEIEFDLSGGKGPYSISITSAQSCVNNQNCSNLNTTICGEYLTAACINGFCQLPMAPGPCELGKVSAPAGSYSVLLADANDCFVNDTIIITEPPILELTSTITNPMCHGGAGEMEFELSGGIGPYLICVKSSQSCLVNSDCSNLNTTICGEYLTAACINGFCSLPMAPGPCELGKVSASAGSYSVLLTDANECSVNDTIIITEPPAIIVTVTPSGNVKSCKGTQLTLAASTNAAVSQFDWLKDGLIIPGQHQQTLMVVEDGSYAVKITDITGCSEMSGDTKVTFKKLPKANIIQQPCQNGAVKLQATEGANYMYKWKKGNKFIDGATLNTYLATADAMYKVEVTNSTGCSKLSGPSEVVISCRQGSLADELTLTSVSLYPNPNGGSFSIELTASDAVDQVATITILNMLGQSVYEEQITLKGGNIKKDVNLDHSLSDGIYQVQVFVNEKIYTEKVILQRK